MPQVALVHVNLADYTAALANALAPLVDLVVVHPTGLAPMMRDRLDPEVRTATFDKPRFRSPGNVLASARLRRLLTSLDPDVVHLQQTDDIWVDAAFALRPPARLVTTLHDLERHPGDGDQVIGATTLRMRLARASAGVVVHTDVHRRTLLARGIADHRILVVPHGELGTLYERLADRPASPQAAPSVLFFGRIWPYKGLDVLIDAMDLVRRNHPDVGLVVAGRGEPVDRYFPRGVPDWCTVRAERIPDGEVSAMLHEASVVALPYREASQSGVAALALGLGRPTVVTDVGGLPEIIDDGRTGLVVPPASPAALAVAIGRILDDPELAARLSRSAREHAHTELAWSRIAARTVELYTAR